MPPSTSARKATSAANRRTAAGKPGRERVLIEFPSAAVRRADEAARAAGISRSEFIRTAVEQSLEAIAEEKSERELAEAYQANSAMNLAVLKEFEHVDREAFEALK